MNNKPEVSIIIPTYNHAHLLDRCLTSVIGQTFSNWEAIVVNNKSKDYTVEVVKLLKDSRIKLVNFSNNGVIAASRNKGVQVSEGKYIAFLDSDDFWYADKLKISLDSLKKADVVYHDFDVYTQRGKKHFKKLQSRQIGSPVFIDLMRNGNAVINSSAVVRRDVVEKVEGLSEDVSIIANEDFDLWLRIAKITDNFLYIPKSLGGYWMGSGKVTEASERHITRMKALYEKHLVSLNGEDKKQSEALRSYSIGRIKQKMHLWDDASKLFKHACSTVNTKMRMRVKCCLIMIILQRLFDGVTGKVKWFLHY